MLVDPWPKKLIWANIPFSHGQVCLYRAIIEYYKGGNIVMLLPWESVESNDFMKTLMRKLVTVKFLPPVKFKGFSRALKK